MYMWSFKILDVMHSGSGYVSRCLASPSSSRGKGSDGESGCRVVDEEADGTESSVSEVAPKDGECDPAFGVAAERRRDRMVWAICDSEKERFCEGKGFEYSITVSRIAVVISS